jgi:leader peptidase (prepilin peptidase) / N-methyltransferase
VVVLSGLPSWLGETYAAVLGLVIGSFLAVCIRRLPEDRSLLTPSACPHCGHPVRWRDNVPVVSWLVLRGRCRDCGARIDALYPLIELLTGLCAWALFRRVFTSDADWDLGHAVSFGARFVFLCLLIVAAYVDLKHRIIPDEVSIYAVPVGLAFSALGQWAGTDVAGTPTLLGSALGAVGWGGGFAVIAGLGRWMSGIEVLGWGDAKLVAMFAAFLGAHGAWLAILVGSLVGAVGGLAITVALWRRPHLAFGPPLAIGGAAYALWGDAVLRWVGVG